MRYLKRYNSFTERITYISNDDIINNIMQDLDDIGLEVSDTGLDVSVNYDFKTGVQGINVYIDSGGKYKIIISNVKDVVYRMLDYMNGLGYKSSGYCNILVGEDMNRVIRFDEVGDNDIANIINLRFFKGNNLSYHNSPVSESSNFRSDLEVAKVDIQVVKDMLLDISDLGRYDVNCDLSPMAKASNHGKEIYINISHKTSGLEPSNEDINEIDEFFERAKEYLLSRGWIIKHHFSTDGKNRVCVDVIGLKTRFNKQYIFSKD